jgi:hypothetical protein
MPLQAQAGKPLTELHVVGISEGTKSSTERIGTATVELDRPKQIVVLVQCAYHPTKWTINVSHLTHLNEVILCGYHKQMITNAPGGLTVTELFHERPNRDWYIGGTHSKSKAEFRKMVEQLRQHTGLEISSFTGMSQPEENKFIRVDKVQADDAPLLSSFPQPDFKGPLPELRFRAVDEIRTPERLPRQVQPRNSFGEFNLKGPVADKHLAVPPDVRRVAELREKDKLVGIGVHDLYFFEPGAQQFESFQLNEWPSYVSWPKDIAVDPDTGRILVLAEHLVSLDPKTREARNELDARGTREWLAFTLSPDNQIIALSMPMPESDDTRAQIVVVDRKGKTTKRLTLGDVFYPGLVGHRSDRDSAQMRLVEDRLIVVTGPGWLSRGENLDRPKYVYVVDLERGTTNLAWRSK